MPLAPGEQKVDQFRAEGFTEAEIDTWIQEARKSALQDGYTDIDFDQWMGIQPYNKEKPIEYARREHNADPEGFLENIEAGFQTSVTGLAIRQRLPDMQTPEDADTFERIGSMVGTLAGDIPAMMAGFAAGGPAILGTGLAFAIPAGLREMMMEQYAENQVGSSKEFMEKFQAIAIASAKGFTVGAATGAAGKLAKIVGLPKVTHAAPEIAAMVTAGAAVEGQLPEPHDFIDAAILIGGAKLARPTAAKLREIYTRTGKTPKAVLSDAEMDPTLKQDLASENITIPNSEKAPNSQSNLAPIKLVDNVKKSLTIRRKLEHEQAKQAKAEAELAKTPEQRGAERAETHRERLKLEEERFKEWERENPPPDTENIKDYPRTEEGTERLQKDIKSYRRKAFDNRKKIEKDLNKELGEVEVADAEHTKDVTVRSQKKQDPDSRGGLVIGLKEDKGARLYLDIFRMEEGQPSGLDPLEAGYAVVSGVTVSKSKQNTGLGLKLYTAALREAKARGLGLAGDTLQSDAAIRVWEGLKRRGFKVETEEASGRRFISPEELAKKDIDATMGLPPRLKSRQATKEGEGPEPITNEEIQLRLEQEGFTGTEVDGPFKTTLMPKEHEMPPKTEPPQPVEKVDPPPVEPPKAGEGGKPPDGGEPTGPPPVEIIQGRLGSQTLPGRTMSRWDQYQTWYRDHLHPLKLFMNTIYNDGPIPAALDAYRKFRNFAGAEHVVLDFIHNNTTYFKDKSIRGKSLQEILKPVHDRMDEFANYLVSKRVIELRTKKGRGPTKGEQGIQTGFEGKDMEAVIDQTAKWYKEKVPEFEAARLELIEFQRHVLEYLRDAGVVKGELIEALIEEGKNYTPFNRINEGGSLTGGTGGGPLKNPLGKIFGSENKIVNPIESIFSNTALYITTAERAHLVDTVFTAVETNSMQLEARGLTDKLAVKRKATPKKTKLTKEEIKKVFDRFRDNPEAELTTKEAKVLESEFEIFRMVKPSGLGRTEVVAFRKGERQVWDVLPDLADVINGLDGEAVTTLVKFMSYPTQWLRAGAVLSPEFITRNVSRDGWGAHLVSDNGFRLFQDSMRGGAHVLMEGLSHSKILTNTKFFKEYIEGGDALYQLWTRSGAAQAELAALGKNYGAVSLRKIMGPGTVFQQVFNLAKSPIEVLRLMSMAGEQATRIGEFKRALPRGKKLSELTREEIDKAGFDSRNLIDFGMMGSRVRSLNHLAAFFNANIQGTFRLGEALYQNPARTLLRAGVSITLPSILLRISNEGEEGFDDIPQWQKDLFWLVPIGEGADRVWFRIPKPFEAGIMFGTAAERMVEFAMFHDKDAFDGFALAAAGAFIPNFIPTALQPAINAYANRNLFTLRPIIPHNRERILPEYQYNAYTTPITRWIGATVADNPFTGKALEKWEFFGIAPASPAIIDNFIRGWTGGLGVTINYVMSRGLEAAGVVPPEPRPNDTLSDLPVIKGWTVRHPSAGAESITNFYDNFKDHEQRILTYQTLLREGEYEAGLQVMKASLGHTVNLSEMRNAITSLSRLIRMIVRDPQIPSGEKNQLIDELRGQQITFAKAGNMIFESIEELMP